ncbi:hypothetical protein DFH28DRAFT_1018815 [Melampsora americana]|nr:hypothetical protein DFH28DRAFT_1018815 [Melampsora americana]
MEELEYQTYSEVEDTNTIITDHQTDSDQEEEEDDDDDEMKLTSTSLREPSPNSKLLFEDSDLALTELPILSSESIQLISNSIITLSPVIAHTLCRYRAQLNQWEDDENVKESVLKASALLDQCLLRIVMILEPIWNQTVKPLIQLEKDLKALQIDYQSKTIFNQSSNSNLTYLNRLMKLSDSISIILENLTDLSKHLNDLYEWIDGFLTPILAELSLGSEDELNSVEIESDRRSSQVSILLDAQSYLCIGLDSLSNHLKLYKESFLKLSMGFDHHLNRFESFYLLHHPLVNDLETLGLDAFYLGLESYTNPLSFFIQSLSVLASISMAIQTDTMGTLHSISYQS